MENALYRKLADHALHHIVCVTYSENVDEVCIECEDCNEVLLEQRREDGEPSDKNLFLVTFTARDGQVENVCRYTCEAASRPTDRQLIADIVPYELDWRGEPDSPEYIAALDELEAHYKLHREIQPTEDDGLIYDITCEELTQDEYSVLKKFGI